MTQGHTCHFPEPNQSVDRLQVPLRQASAYPEIYQASYMEATVIHLPDHGKQRDN